MNKYIYDPNMIQVKSLELLSKGLNNEIDLPDPTNPFTFLLENNALVTSAALQDTKITMRKMYPYLAKNKEDLYPHINSSEILDIFSVPSKAFFNLHINKKDLELYGKNTGTYSEIIIPKFSNITVADTVFTILNDIYVRVYKNNSIFSKLIANDIPIAENKDTIIESNTVTDNDGLEWIMLNISVKQIKYYNYKDTIIQSKPYENTMTLDADERYTFLTTKSVNNNNSIFTLNSTYSNFMYNPNVPTVIIRPMDNILNIEIPSVYLLNKMVNSYINIELYTTKGNIELFINKYVSKDFVFSIELPSTTDERMIGTKNINYVINASTKTFGGIDELSFEELKTKIINYSTGDNEVPITIYDIKDKVAESGFTFKKASNTILERELLVNKKIGNLDYNVYSSIDVFHNNTKLYLPNINSDKIKSIDDNIIVIEPFQIFKYNEDSSLTPLTTYEATILKTNLDILEYNKNKYFFTLYKYIVDYKDTLNVRIYDVNQPTISNYKRRFSNDELNSPIAINSRHIIKTLTGYRIVYNLLPTNELLSMDATKIKCQISIPLNANNFIYFKGDLVLNNNTYTLVIDLETDNYITEKDEIIFRTDIGEVKVATVDLESKLFLDVYSNDQAINDTVLYNSINIIDDDFNVLLYEEEFDGTLGIHLTHLYKNYYIEYTERKFKKYTEDVYLTYKENVYNLDENGLPNITYIDTDGDGTDDDIILDIKHNIGEFVLDDNGNKIVLHKEGDIILDEDNQPIIDNTLGIIHNLDLLLMEDSFLRTNNDIYKSYRVDFFKELTKVIDTEITSINDNLLDNSIFKFLPSNDLDTITLNINYNKIAYDNFVKPIVNLYINNETSFLLTDDIEKTIFNIVQTSLLGEPVISEIEKTIAENIGDEILSVNIENITRDDNINIINYEVNSSKFVIDKKLVTYTDGSLVVKPDLTINIIKI